MVGLVALFLVAVIVAIVGLFAAATVSVQTTVKAPPPQTVPVAVVPNFIAMKPAQALALARERGLNPEVRLISAPRHGVVIAQIPASGARVRRGSTVVLRVGRR